MQSLDDHIWKSKISFSTKEYNTCILSIFLHGSECGAVTKRDILMIDALDQWCLRKMLGIKFQQKLKSNNLSVNETIDVAHNRPLWRLTTTFGAMHY